MRRINIEATLRWRLIIETLGNDRRSRCFATIAGKRKSRKVTVTPSRENRQVGFGKSLEPPEKGADNGSAND